MSEQDYLTARVFKGIPGGLVRASVPTERRALQERYIKARLNAHLSGREAAKFKAIEATQGRQGMRGVPNRNNYGWAPKPASKMRGGRNSRNVSRKYLKAIEEL